MQPAAGPGQQLWLFLQSLLLGAAMVFLYDILRMIRRILWHGIICLSLEDLLYWLIMGGYFFLRLCQVNDGIIRAYILLGMILGAGIYYRFCSCYFMRWITKIIMDAKKRLKKWGKLVTMKMRKLRRLEKTEESGKKNE